MQPRRVLALMHQDLVPPASLDGIDAKRAAEIRTEWDVVTSLAAAGHDVRKLGVRDDLGALRAGLDEHKPHVVFNLLEEFAGQVLYDQHVVSFLELQRVPYTGCGPRGMVLARDKAISKEILHYHRVDVPAFAVFPRDRVVRRPRHVAFPLIVKSLTADASLGIAQASVVDSDARLRDRVEFIHRTTGTDAIAEQYIEGRELYVGVFGNQRLEVLPVWEMIFANLPDAAEPIATERVKWDVDYQRRHGIDTRRADLPVGVAEHIQRVSKRIYRHLWLSGYARLDFRLHASGRVYLIEANPNPNIAQGEDFALSAQATGMAYPDLLNRILLLGLRAAGQRDSP